MIEHIPDLCAAGLDCLKIEGRMKNALYVAAVTRTYRRALDDYEESEARYRANMDWYLAQIRRCTYRRFSTGFYYGRPDEDAMVYESNSYLHEAVWLGICEEIRRDGLVRLTQRNKFRTGDVIEIMKPDGRDVPVRVLRIETQDGEVRPDAPHPQQVLYVQLSEPAEEGDLLRTAPEGDRV